MSLQVWLPLNGDLHNQGLSGNLAVANSGATIDNNGKIGKCYSFNGSSDYLRFLYPASNLQGEWSFSCWVKINNITSKFTLLSSRKTTGAGMSIFILAGKIRFDNGSDSANSQTQFTTSLTASTWQHITLVQTATQRKFYLNGILKETLNGNALSSGNTAQYILVGASASADTTPTDNWLNGYLNDVRIYNHALSPKEVEEIAKGLVLHYKLDKINKNLFKYNGLNNYNQELQLNNYRNTGSFTQFSDCLTIDPANYLNQKFTISFDAISPNGTTPLLLYNQNGNPRYFYYSTTLTSSLGNAWQHFKYTFTNIDRGSSYSAGSHPLEIYMPSQMGGKIRNVKVEIGEIETNWTLYTQTDMETTIYDSSGYSHNGTIIGSLTAAVPSPRYDVATYIDGTGPYINSNNNFSFLNESPFTISIWVYCEDWAAATTSAAKYIIQNYNSTNGGFRIYSGSGANRYRIFWIDTEGTTRSTYFSANDALTSGWAFFTATYDGTTMKTYLNGNHYGSGTYSFKSTTSSPSLLVGNGAASVPGNYSDFRIYATALTAAQVKELYTTSMSIDASGNVHARELVEL